MDEAAPKRWRLSRRGFLIGLGATGTVLALGVKVGVPYARLQLAGVLAGASGPPGALSAPPTTWFEVTASNRVRLFVPKIEMGQGIHTALAQIGAEELEIEWAQLEVVQATTRIGLRDSMGTGASNSVSSLYQPLREAAATLREMLRTAAAARLDVTADRLVLANGVFSVAGEPSRAVSYGQLVADQATWEVPETPPPLKPASQHRFIGRSLPRVDLADKVTGRAVYGYDVRLPGMLYGAVARPPTAGARLRRAAPGEAPARDGVVSVVSEADFAGVAATSRRAAYLGVAAMDVSWDDGETWQQADIEDLVTVGNGTGVVIQKEGDTPANLAVGRSLIAEYRTPLAAHAHLEPQAALVDVQPKRVTAWVSTQSPFQVRDELADLLDRPAEQVEVIPTYLGGGFGRRLNVAVALEAARLSAAAGRPVHVGWNRTEEFQQGYLRPPSHHILKASLTAGGRIHALEHQQASSDVAFISLPPIAATVMGADFGAWRGALIPYAAPHRRTVAWRVRLPVRTGWWRGLGLLANTFALESFMDELAETAGVDPVTFRLQHLPPGELGERLGRALRMVADRADWGGPLPPGRARGVACAVDVGTVVAQVAEVSVDDGRLRVHRFTAVVDPGLVINPDGVIAQSQGAIVMGLGSTLLEEMRLVDGRFEARNFDRYPLPSMADTPDINIVLQSGGQQPHGVGEPPLGPVAAAVANAAYPLTARRLRRLPLTL